MVIYKQHCILFADIIVELTLYLAIPSLFHEWLNVIYKGYFKHPIHL